MNLKKTMISILGGFALIASLASPAAFAQSYSSGTGTGEVDVTSDGEFSVSICNSKVLIDFGSVGANTDTSVTASGSLTICIVDTHVQRQGFQTMLSATDFTASGVATTIPASGLVPTVIYGPVVGQTFYYPNGGTIYGDHANPFAAHNVVEPVIFPGAANSENWGGGALNSPQMVGHGDAGRGTSWAEQQIDMELTVPNNTLVGTYTNTITVDLSPRTFD